jgi:hypothetical protein
MSPYMNMIPLQRRSMPAPSRGWTRKLPRPTRQPLLGTMPGPSSRWTTMTMDPKPPNGQAAALVAVADTHPERRSGHPPERDPPPADAYTRTIARVDDDDDQPRQTTRWSSGGPSRGRGLAPQTDTVDRTQPHKTARRGGGRFRAYVPP